MDRDVVINCTVMQAIDARFIGLLLMLDKQAQQKVQAALICPF